MRGDGVVTTLLPPAADPLQTGDQYVVRIGRLMTLRCRVLESTCRDQAEEHHDRCVFDSVGVAFWGLIKGRFRFTFFTDENGEVVARAEEKIMSLPLLRPTESTLEAEHRHTFTDLDRSFVPFG